MLWARLCTNFRSASYPAPRKIWPRWCRHPSSAKTSPPRLDTLIVSMLAADREERPHSAQMVLGELCDIERTAALDLLIAGGESASLEFKQTMRWDTKLQKRSTEVQRASMKTVCAFLNSGGGTLLIGVADTGKPTGPRQPTGCPTEKTTPRVVPCRWRTHARLTPAGHSSHHHPAATLQPTRTGP